MVKPKTPVMKHASLIKIIYKGNKLYKETRVGELWSFDFNFGIMSKNNFLLAKALPIQFFVQFTSYLKYYTI